MANGGGNICETLMSNIKTGWLIQLLCIELPKKHILIIILGITA